ncbi:hypothetical protein DBR22_22180 [Arthrobacter sp. HMWF013]|nr:hypothetical protein DBR22_22180 [Arthrobacter sp. HMWF013]
MTGLGLVIGGVAIMVIGNASSSYLSLPLGIAIAVLGVILLITYAFDKNRKNRAFPVQANRHRIRSIRGVRGKDSLASDLATLADLYSQGALSRGEFEAAKRRILDI